MRKTVQVVTELTINKMTTSKYWEEKNAGRINPDELYLVVPDAEHVEMTWENITNKPALYTKTESDERYQPKGNYLTSIPAEYLTETKGNSLYQPSGNYLTAVPNTYQTTATADGKYATKTEVGNIGTLLDEINGVTS